MPNPNIPNDFTLIEPDERFKNVDFSKLIDANPQPRFNFGINQNVIKPKTPEENLRFLTDQLSSMQEEIANQTNVIQTLRYDNAKQIAQIEVLNKTNDKQLSEISQLKENEIISKNKIVSLNQTIINLENSNKYQGIKTFLSGVIVTVIGGVIVWFITTRVI
jgi:hypothetical protein